LSLLGRFAATGDNREIRVPAASQRLLALAALHRRPLPRAFVAERLWPHLHARSALGSLRSAVYRARAAHPALLASGTEDVSLTEWVRVDVREVEEMALQLIDGAAGYAASDVPVDRLTVPLLPDCDDDWVVFERGRLQELCLHALEAHAARLADDRRYAHAIAAAYTALRADPLRESAARTLIEVHLAEGNRAQAAHCYMEFRQRLTTALGMEPSEEMRRLIAPLIRRRP
jgi:DNA-binding SARP family transcriptional activator